MSSKTSSSREGLQWIKVRRFLSLPFSPDRLKTYQRVHRFEDISIEGLWDDGIRGLLLDADGTLGHHHATSFPEPVIQHIKKMLQRGFKLAVYTNASENRFGQIPEVPVVTHVPPKPDPVGFEIAMRDYLKLNDPQAVCMVGDNYITDGGAVDAGMRFLHVHPLPGPENPFHRLTRWLAERLAHWHHAEG